VIPHTFVLATHNAHKVAEFQQMLGDRYAGLTVVSYDGPEPTEDGTTFAENALIKARVAAAHTGLPALADDSGLCVDVMNGAPGIFSARWAGAKRGDLANMALLLEQMSDVPDPHRGAHYACVIALVIPGDDRQTQTQTQTETVVEGQWRGSLERTPRGAEGFGYDPIFVPDGESRTAAEMGPGEKNARSHRALALQRLFAELDALDELG
jgi:XTP/dITP diphosphohydrolase